jgi:cell division protein FtsB
MLFILITVYFGYHGIYGNHGLLRLNQLREETQEAEVVLNDLNADVVALKTKVDAIKKGSQDLIEEELLRVLNMGDSDGLVILTAE